MSMFGLMFGPKPGTWWFSSKKDPRWDANGHTDALLFSAGLPKEAKEALEKLQESYGEPPDDLEFGGMKD